MSGAASPSAPASARPTRSAPPTRSVQASAPGRTPPLQRRRSREDQRTRRPGQDLRADIIQPVEQGLQEVPEGRHRDQNVEREHEGRERPVPHQAQQDVERHAKIEGSQPRAPELSTGRATSPAPQRRWGWAPISALTPDPCGALSEEGRITSGTSRGFPTDHTALSRTGESTQRGAACTTALTRIAMTYAPTRSRPTPKPLPPPWGPLP